MENDEPSDGEKSAGESPRSLGPPGARLRELADRRAGAVVPGVFNALSARLAGKKGFPAVYLSGAAFSAAELALPDVGLFTLTELAQQTARISLACDVPLIVDADTGFGQALNVERTIVELERAGAGAVQLEDQQSPKRCGHLSGKSLVDLTEMSAKLRAACAARNDPNTVILARTDARGVDDFDAAVERGLRYLDAGADWIFPEALRTAEEFAEYARRVPAPLVANMTEFGHSPLLTAAELGAMGYAVVLFPVTLMRVAMKAVERMLERLAEKGSQAGVLSDMQTRRELYELLGYQDFESRDQRYFEG